MKTMLRTLAILIAGVFLMNATNKASFGAEDQVDEIKLADTEEVVVFHTESGDMVLQMYPDVAPKHVENIKKLAKKGYYDGTKFHRTIPGFMIQGGCPNTKDDSKSALWGTGDPGYKVKQEFNDKLHVRGTLSMARSMDPDSAGSQFFVCHARAKHLDKQYTVFGQLIYGFKTLDKIVTAPAIQDGRENSRPKKPVAITKAEVATWGDYKKSMKKD